MQGRTDRALILAAVAAASVALPLAVSGQGPRADPSSQGEARRSGRDLGAGAKAAAAQAAIAQCQMPLSALGQGKLQSGARNNAKLNWQHDAKSTYGVGWDNWGVAIEQDTSCAHDRRPPHLREWSCIATARACFDAPAGSSSSSSGSSSSSSSGSTGSPTCQPAMSVEGGDTKLQMPAEAQAVSDWQQAASNAYGADFQAWAKAAGKDITCRHNGLGPLQRRWRCVATAQPCQ